MDNAPTSWVKMKYLFLINSFSVALTFGQSPISKPPSFPQVEIPDLTLIKLFQSLRGVLHKLKPYAKPKSILGMVRKVKEWEQLSYLENIRGA